MKKITVTSIGPIHHIPIYPNESNHKIAQKSESTLAHTKLQNRGIKLAILIRKTGGQRTDAVSSVIETAAH